MKPPLKIFLIISFYLCFHSAFSQKVSKVDSLLYLLKTQADDTAKVNTLNELAWEFREINTTEARDYGTQAKVLSESLDFERGRITALVRLGQIAVKLKEYNTAERIFLDVLKAEIKEKYQYGISRAQTALSEVYRNKGDLKKALSYGLEALQTFKSINDRKSEALITNKIGILYKETGDYDKAIEYLLNGQEIRKQVGNQKDIGTSFLSIGSFYISLEKTAAAIEYLNKSKAVFEALGDKYNLAKVYNNLGVAHFKWENYDTSLEYYKRSLDLKEELGLEDKDPIPYQNMGAIYHKEHKLDIALDYYLKSISIHKSKPGKNILMDTYTSIADVYYRKENYEKAIEACKKALQMAERSSKKIIQLKILDGLRRSYEELGQYDSALLYSNRYIDLNDRLEQRYRTAVEFEADYEQQQKDNEILEVKNKRKSTLIYSLIAGLVLAVLLFFSILRGNRKKQEAKLSKEKAKLAEEKIKRAEEKAKLAEKDRQIKEQEVKELLKNQELKSMDAMREGQEKEQKRIAKDLHDRLGGMLSMVKLHFKSVEDNIENLKADNKKQYARANNLLDKACDEVRKIAHNMISGVLMKFGLVAALENLKETLEESGQIAVEFIAHGMDNRLDNDTEISIYRIVQELISNILKHAEAEEISIQLLKSNSALSIVVEDDGIGFDTNTIKDAGMGLQNVRFRVDQLNGELNIDSTPGNGATVTIDIPQ